MPSTISFSTAPFSSCLQSFPASGSFPMNQLFVLSNQSIGAPATVLPMNIQGWFPFGLTGLISLLSKGLSSVFSNTTIQNHQFFSSDFFMGQLSHLYMTTGKNIALTRQTFVSKLMSLLLDMQSSFVMAFLPRSKHVFIWWLQSPSAVIWEAKKIKSVTASTVSLSICHEVMGPDAMILVFWMLSSKSVFSLSSFTLIKKLCSSSSLSTLEWCLLLIWGSLVHAYSLSHVWLFVSPLEGTQAYIKESFIWNTSANISHKKLGLSFLYWVMYNCCI